MKIVDVDLEGELRAVKDQLLERATQIKIRVTTTHFFFQLITTLY